MKLSAAVASLAGAGSALATAFELMALRPDSPIHLAPFSAAQSNLFLHLPHQNASCEGEHPNRATFYIKHGSLFLYSKDGETQEIFVDRSGMGQGKMGYLTNSPYVPPHFELENWQINSTGDLSFNGRTLIACPHSIDRAWSLWVDTSNPTPGGNKGCLPIRTRAIPVNDPIRCDYSH
ncbi:hypothetical protein V501_07263 [Pseudogymnoascus sp. VKM F-4519 (FW-2642)]|nr:hypothetical protein V501_07263 [Pseudogymnoascus sp. VKM F-4519 (FW-2642)]